MINRILFWTAVVLTLAIIEAPIYAFFHWPRIEVFQSQFAEGAFERWKANEEGVTDVTDMVSQYLKPGTGIAECRAIFQTLGFSETSAIGPSEPPIAPLHGILFVKGDRSAYVYADAEIAIEVKFLNGKLVSLVASIGTGDISRKSHGNNPS